MDKIHVALWSYLPGEGQPLFWCPPGCLAPCTLLSSSSWKYLSWKLNESSSSPQTLAPSSSSVSVSTKNVLLRTTKHWTFNYPYKVIIFIMIFTQWGKKQNCQNKNKNPHPESWIDNRYSLLQHRPLTEYRIYKEFEIDIF